MKFEFGATLGFHGESSACSGTSALQDRATALAPSFPEYLEVFLEDRESSNEFINSEKNASEVSKSITFQRKNYNEVNYGGSSNYLRLAPELIYLS